MHWTAAAQLIDLYRRIDFYACMRGFGLPLLKMWGMRLLRLPLPNMSQWGWSSSLDWPSHSGDGLGAAVSTGPVTVGQRLLEGQGWSLGNGFGVGTP